MNKPLFALLVAVLAVPAFAGDPGEDAFNRAVYGINESVAKIIAAQAKRSQAPKDLDSTVKTAPRCTPAQADAAYADLKRCEDSVKKAYGVSLRDFKGNLATGFGRGGYNLVLLTTTDAYFYHEDCDICAAVDKCSLKDGVLTDYKTAHSVDCSDLAPAMKAGTVVTSSCP